jgi:hypothetical protein
VRAINVPNGPYHLISALYLKHAYWGDPTENIGFGSSQPQTPPRFACQVVSPMHHSSPVQVSRTFFADYVLMDSLQHSHLRMPDPCLEPVTPWSRDGLS